MGKSDKKEDRTPFEIIGKENIKQYLVKAFQKYNSKYCNPHHILAVAQQKLYELMYLNDNEVYGAREFLSEAFEMHNIFPLLEELVSEGKLEKRLGKRIKFWVYRLNR